MKKDSKHICKGMEKRGVVIHNNPETGEKTATNNYHCITKNINLNNINCGICNTFKNVKDPDIEVTEILEIV